MKAIDKAKRHIKEHKEEIICGVLAASGWAIGFIVGGKVNQLQISLGLEKMHKAGFIKFFDPEKAVEVTVDEVCNLVSKAKL